MTTYYYYHINLLYRFVSNSYYWYYINFSCILQTTYDFRWYSLLRANSKLMLFSQTHCMMGNSIKADFTKIIFKEVKINKNNITSNLQGSALKATTFLQKLLLNMSSFLWKKVPRYNQKLTLLFFSFSICSTRFLTGLNFLKMCAWVCADPAEPSEIRL